MRRALDLLEVHVLVAVHRWLKALDAWLADLMERRDDACD